MSPSGASSDYCKKFLRFQTELIDDRYRFPAYLDRRPSPAFPVHQVLLLDELIRNISHCVGPTPEGSASLLAFARCCKSFEEPVMDILWQRQVDLSTILKTLPADSWTVTGNVFVREKLRSPVVSRPLPISQTLLRNLSPDEWKRFKKYTARVTTLGVPKMHMYRILWESPQAWVSVETIQLLGMESQRGGFWPGLRFLKCNIDWEIVPFISLFLTPTITSLDLTLPREGNRLLQPSLSLLTHTCHQLQSLTMDVDASGPLSGGEMGRLISASQHTLRRVEIKCSTPPDIFPVIFNLPRLQDLALQGPPLPKQIPPKILARLKIITFNGSHGPYLPQFLRELSAQRLAKVSISYGGIIQLSTLLESLRGASTTINMLHLLPIITLDHSSTTLLRSFTNLTYFSVGCVCEDITVGGPCSFQLADENVLALGGALPHVRTLNLARGCRGPRHITFTSLIHLSRTCGNLVDLSIRVDFTSIGGGSDQLNHNNPSLGISGAHPQRTRSKLGTLNVGNSPLPNIPRCEWVVALALVSIFPFIRSVSSFCFEEAGKRWEEVKKDILVCQEIFRIAQAAGKCLSVHV